MVSIKSRFRKGEDIESALAAINPTCSFDSFHHFWMLNYAFDTLGVLCQFTLGSRKLSAAETIRYRSTIEFESI